MAYIEPAYNEQQSLMNALRQADAQRLYDLQQATARAMAERRLEIFGQFAAQANPFDPYYNPSPEKPKQNKLLILLT